MWSQFVENSIWMAWILGTGLAVLVWLVLLFTKNRAETHLQKIREKDPQALPYTGVVLEETKGYFLLGFSLYIGVRLPAHPGNLAWDLQQYIFLIILVQIGIWGHALLKKWAKVVFKKKKETDAAQASAIGILQLMASIALWIILAVAGLSSLGVEVGTLVAGLGVGGIAIALASQKILGDLFASFTIVMDKPFAVGDFIIVGDIKGHVENIGLKTTRIRSLGGEQLILPNSDLLESRIQNFQRMKERRNQMLIGVVYQTPLDKLKRIPEIVREIIEAQEQVRLDRVHFKEFGPHSLNFEIVYYALTREYKPFMEIQQTINLALFERFHQEGITFAYPTQTVFVENPESQ